MDFYRKFPCKSDQKHPKTSLNQAREFKADRVVKHSAGSIGRLEVSGALEAKVHDQDPQEQASNDRRQDVLSKDVPAVRQNILRKKRFAKHFISRNKKSTLSLPAYWL